MAVVLFGLASAVAAVASFLIFNLFIGIVLNAMEEARAADNKEHETDDLLSRLRAAREALEQAEKLQRHGDHEKPSDNRQTSLGAIERAVQHRHRQAT